MLLILPYWFWIFLVTTSFGWFGYNYLFGFFNNCGKKKVNVEIYSLIGICLLSWFLGFISLFSNIGIKVQIIVSLLTCLIILFNFNAFIQDLKSNFLSLRFFPLAFSFIGIFTFLILIHAAMPPVFADSGLYHAQFIKWIHIYPVIPGLGNVHGRLAFNSHLHLLSALFSPESSLFVPFQQVFSSYLFLLFTYYQIRQITKYITEKDAIAFFYLGALLWVFIGFRPWISSPMPDSSITILVLFILGLFLEMIGKEPPIVFSWEEHKLTVFILLLITLTGITFKLSSVFIGIIFLYIFWLQKPTDRSAFIKMAVALIPIVLMPWIIRNIMLSGYLYYPFPVFDFFSLDWAILPEKVYAERMEILYFARWPTDDWIFAPKLSFSEWFPFWYSQQNRADLVIIFLLIMLAICHIVYLIFRIKLKNIRLFHVFFLLLFCCIVWFLTAPAIRFGYGYLIGAAMIGIYNVIPAKLNRLAFYLLPYLGIIYGLNGIRNEIIKLEKGQWLIPADYQKGNLVKKYVGSTLIWFATGDGKCWNGAIPCTLEINPDLQLRGDKITDGFRINKKHKE